MVAIKVLLQIYVMFGFFLGGILANNRAFVGCYRDKMKKRLLPEHIFTDRGSIAWGNQDEYFCNLLERCAKEAFDNGYPYYGIEFYGECWAGGANVNFPSKKRKSAVVAKHKGKECQIGGSLSICVYVHENIPCGHRSIVVPPAGWRIIGGHEATPNSWPWIVEITHVESGYHYCGGALIAPDWVLTAAHCFFNMTSDMLLRIGAHDLLVSGSYEQTRLANDVYIHPLYDDYELDYDVALIHLEEPILFHDRVHAICLPSETTVLAPGTACTVIGWGMLNITKEVYSDVLMEVSVPLVSLETCNATLSYDGLITDRNLCAGYAQGGKDSCYADSGGPLMCRDDQGVWTVAGVVSWGDECALPYKYGVYTDVKKMLPFINAHYP